MAAEASRSWRETLTSQQRASVQKHIFTRLAALVQGVSEQDLWARSVTFEEREFMRASSQEEYLHRIAAGLQNAERAVGHRSDTARQPLGMPPHRQQQSPKAPNPLLMAPQPERMNGWRVSADDALHAQLDEQRKRSRSACSNSSVLNQTETRPSRAYSMTSIPVDREYRKQMVQATLAGEHERSPNSFSVSSVVDGTRAPYVSHPSPAEAQQLGNMPTNERMSGAAAPFKRTSTPLSQQLFSAQQKEVIRTVLDAYHEMPEDLRVHGFGALPPHVIERLAQVFPNDPIVFAAFAAAMAVGPAQREVVYMRFVAALNAAREAAARYAISKSLSMAAASMSAQVASPSLRRSASLSMQESGLPASPKIMRSVSTHAMECGPHESPTRVFAELADFQAREGQAFRAAFGVIRTALQRQTDPFLREKHLENIQGILNLIQMNPSNLGGVRCPTLTDIQKARNYVRRWLALLHDVAGRGRNATNALRRGEAGTSSPNMGQINAHVRENADMQNLNTMGLSPGMRIPPDIPVSTSMPTSMERNLLAQTSGLSSSPPAAATAADMVDSNRWHTSRTRTPTDFRLTSHAEVAGRDQPTAASMDTNVVSRPPYPSGTAPSNEVAIPKLDGSAFAAPSSRASRGDYQSMVPNFGTETVAASHSPTQIPVMVPSLVTVVDENGTCVTLPTNVSPTKVVNADNEAGTQSARNSSQKTNEKITVDEGDHPSSVSTEQSDSNSPRAHFIEIVGKELESATADFLPTDESMKLERSLDWELGGPVIRLNVSVAPTTSPALGSNVVFLHFPILLMAYPSPRYLERQCRGIAITFRSLLSPTDGDEWAFRSCSRFLTIIRDFCAPEEARKIDRTLDCRVLRLRVLLLYANISVYDMARHWIQSIYAFAPIRDRAMSESGLQPTAGATPSAEEEFRAAAPSLSNDAHSPDSYMQRTMPASETPEMRDEEHWQRQAPKSLVDAVCQQWEAANGTN
ncbi:hypothetical protein CCYA_CCYA20G4788 [Cyanidiococcus yangmingshanensis]|nr:hypothetical protein CCYA_CCYA20G4788 [Cyanidiococcus yangmingshanensis]